VRKNLQTVRIGGRDFGPVKKGKKLREGGGGKREKRERRYREGRSVKEEGPKE